MAKLKYPILVTAMSRPTEAMEGVINVWANNVGKRESDIYRIEGITITRVEHDNQLKALTDPRYDIDEIVAEIKALFAEKPEAK